jgi:hypothetical protein
VAGERCVFRHHFGIVGVAAGESSGSTMINRNISRVIAGLLGTAFALLLSSCYETKQDFMINPDGSGKVRHECSFQSVNLNNENDTSEEALQAAVAKIGSSRVLVGRFRSHDQAAAEE